MDGHAVAPLLHGQLVDTALQPGADKGDGVVRLNLLDKDVAHLVVGAGIFDLMYQLVFHGGPPFWWIGHGRAYDITAGCLRLP